MRFYKRSEKAGLPPGVLVHIGKRKSDFTKVTVYGFSESFYLENQTEDRDNCLALLNSEAAVRWVNVDGLARVEILEMLGSYYSLHPLTLEYILNTDQRPKIETFENYTYIVLKMLSYNDAESVVETEQISLVFGSDFVLSFQEWEGDVFASVRERVSLNKGRIRKMGADYLMYSLLDAVVDAYFTVLEKVGERIENAEDILLANPSQQTLHEVYKLKREMVYLRRAVWPLREVVSKLEKADVAFITKPTEIFMRDVYDHIIQVIDTTEIYREMLSGMLDIYLSSVNNKMNEVMKVLTMIATIFIPLTLISGIYGMNFEFMPELNWHYGYPVVLAIMFGVSLSMLIYFRRKKWL
jgi:magnesium transporter